MFRATTLVLASALALLALAPLRAAVTCQLVQLTDAAASSGSPSVDGSAVAFHSQADLTGDNPDGNFEVFLYDGSSLFQVTSSTTSSPFEGSIFPSLDAGAVAFLSNADLTGQNGDGNTEVFLFDGASIIQITDEILSGPGPPSMQGGSIAFSHGGNLTGDNPHPSRSQIFLWDGSSIVQITGSALLSADSPSLHGGAIAFAGVADGPGAALGDDPQIFLYDGNSITQITHSTTGASALPSLHGDAIAFMSSSDLTGGNPDSNFEVFLFDGSTIGQITHTTTRGAFPTEVRLQASSLTFASDGDPTGDNPDGNTEIFLYDGSSLTQITDSSTGTSSSPSVDGALLAFSSTRPFDNWSSTGGHFEIFLAECVPAPPPGAWLSSPDLPGFEAKVLINDATPGSLELDCIPETLCVSGALAGRPEIFTKVIGPRPTGFLWTQISRFTPSKVEVWLRQTSSGHLNYYALDALGPASDDVSGLQDREAFSP